MPHADETVSALNELIGPEGVSLYAIITVGTTAYFISGRLEEAFTVQGENVKFRVGIKTTFNGVTYTKMTDLYNEMVRIGKETFKVDLSSKNFDCWGRFHIIIPREGQWMSTTLRGLLSRSMRQGKIPFSNEKMAYRPALEVYNHIKCSKESIFTVASAPRKVSRKREAFEMEEQDTYAPTPKVMKMIEDLQMAYIILNNGAKSLGSLKDDANAIVKAYPNTSHLSDLLSMNKSEAQALMRFAQS
jgi:hypothetical protein